MVLQSGNSRYAKCKLKPQQDFLFVINVLPRLGAWYHYFPQINEHHLNINYCKISHFSVKQFYENLSVCSYEYMYVCMYSTASAEPSFEHPSPRFTSTCSLKMTTAIGVFCRYFGWCTNTADPDGRTRWSLILYNLHVQCRQWKTVDRDDPSQAITANPRVRSSRYARVMTTRVNGFSVAVFDRAWIILTTGVRGFMKVPRWLYCNLSLYNIFSWL